ncbi:nucleoside-diphosphate kinase [Candidatus Beckwithbacteria bacterium]|nr:nucleoside-diphosphate kinase [Candidatus Beckwithbacteria bacterium]
MQRSCVLVKPDGIQRGLIGEIIARFERKGLKLVGLKMMQLDGQILEKWYAHHKDKPFFKDLQRFMTSLPIVAMVWEGVDCIAAMRKLCGVTKGREAEAGSIRGDFAMSQSNNLIHASDSEESAQKEISLIFKDNEIFAYKKDVELHVYSQEERE